ncbi:phage protein Gp27 family protein [Alloalcanivorax xenomutans]|uniref:phage protein Gp27 family protein n=1 Tax=Alloalcanivorax xenomutans TaxID=1094342 RepID=UPI00300B514F
MGRKSSIEQMPAEVRSHIEKRLREGRMTLDELIADLKERFPSVDHPSRSSVGRYSKQFDELTRRAKEQQDLAAMLVSELGENPDERAGALMVQSITTLTTHAALSAQSEEEVDIDAVRKLARAAKDVLHARKASMEERRQIAKEARDKLLQEQQERLEEMRGSDGMSEQLESRIKGILLGRE